LREVLDAALRHLSPNSDMAKAIAYGTKRWPALSRFLDDGRLEIDNKIAERALRGIAVGHRNWLFAGSRAGGERAAAIYTVIQTCKANGIDPQAYIAKVFAKVAGDWPACRWGELVPGTGCRRRSADRTSCVIRGLHATLTFLHYFAAIQPRKQPWITARPS